MVAGPGGIKVPAQVDGPELDDGLGHRLSPAHSQTLHPILDEVLACALDRAASSGRTTPKGKTVNVKLTPALTPLFRAASQQISKTEGPSEPARASIANCPPVSNQTGAIRRGD